jgi:pyrrolidone-carboxylate peptidase
MPTPFEFLYKLNSEAAQSATLSNIANAGKKEYEPVSHFFVDETKLATITPTVPPAVPAANYATDAFGPVAGSETTKYRTTSVVRATGTVPVKVFAICDGQVLLQPNYDASGTIDATKLNIVLKPSASYNPLKIKYFIYRGVRKEDLMDASNKLKETSNDANQPPFIAKLWTQFKNFYPDTPPTVFPASLIGFDPSVAETTLIDNAFTKKDTDKTYQLPLCSAGEHIANFIGAIGLDIVLDYGDYHLENQEELFKLDLKYARKNDAVFDTTTPTLTDAVKIKRYKEHIHQFMDAAAFWGSHIECGSIELSDASKIKTNTLIFASIVNKYQTQNKIYVYIQGENNRSYNYYDATRKVYGFNTAGQLNETSGWPIIIEDLTVAVTTPATSKKGITFSLEYNIDTRIPEAERHVVVDVISPNNKTSVYPLLEKPKNPIAPATIPAFLINKTASITTVFQVNGTKSCASFLMLFGNLKQEFPLKNYYNDLFPVNFNTNFSIPASGTENLSVWATYDKSRMVNLDNVLDTGAMIQNKLVFDTGFRQAPVQQNIAATKKRRLYMAILKRNAIHNVEYDTLNIDTVTAGIETTTTAEQYVLNVYNNKEFSVYKGTFTEGATIINSLSLIHENSSVKKNSFFHLGITDEEYNTLLYGQITVPAIVPPATTVAQNLPADADNVFFHLEEALPFANQNVQKFKVGFRFENAIGATETWFPLAANNVFVYTIDGFYFFSAAYATYQGYFVTTDTYKRNYEEKIGFENNEPTSNKRYEDWFIEKDNGMKVKVDSFITALSQINNDDNFYSTATTLVANSALGIWNQAVSTVQANANTTPDDRPLYWARLKMEVALKSHAHFGGGNNKKDLENLIQLFEEKSRNYTGVNFSVAPAGTKKILITGFDPFQLYNNKEQQNPSGIVALTLHGKILKDSLGNKAFIQVAIFPVRYYDFDRKAVENLVKSFLQNNSINMIMTLSLNGGAYYFDLERFAGKKRSGGSDNLKISKTSLSFKQIQNTEEGNEFYQTTLPVANIITNQLTNNFDLASQRFFYDQSYKAGNQREHVTIDPRQPNSNVDSFQFIEISGKSDTGSGGSYLSNEIFYRVARLRDSLSSTVKTGHFHLANTSPSEIPNNIQPFTMIEIINESQNAITRSINNI